MPLFVDKKTMATERKEFSLPVSGRKAKLKELKAEGWRPVQEIPSNRHAYITFERKVISRMS